jgi:signal peptidase I
MVDFSSKPFFETTTDLGFLLIGLIAMKAAIKQRSNEEEDETEGTLEEAKLFAKARTHYDLLAALFLMIAIVPTVCLKAGWLWFNLPFCLLLAASYLFIAVPARGHSMMPTINCGDIVIAERGPLFKRRPIRRGDIVLFPRPLGIETPGIKNHASLYSLIFGPALLKRVIGLPGETVRVANGRVYINDQILVENAQIPLASYELSKLGDLGNKSFIPYSGGGHASEPITVPEGHYFVLGDFRVDENLDSHVFGFVPLKVIWGRVLARLPVKLPGVRTPREGSFEAHLNDVK